MRILITGGAGFIGSHVVEALATEGNSVVVLDNLSSGRRENLPDDGRQVRLIHGDIREVERIQRAVNGADVVVHLAALVSVPASIEDPVSSASVNIHGTALLLHECQRAGVDRLIFASSAAVYGDTEAAAIPEHHAKTPQSPYGVHKLTGEHLCRVAAEHGGPDTLCFRFFNVYGARQRPDSDYAAVIPAFSQRCAHGQPPRIHGDGSQTRDFIHVSEVVEAIRRGIASESPFRGEVYNLARGQATSINDLARAVMKNATLDGDIEYTPERGGDIAHSVADVSKLHDRFDWHPILGLAEGLKI